jgi:hypothetical protein
VVVVAAVVLTVVVAVAPVVALLVAAGAAVEPGGVVVPPDAGVVDVAGAAGNVVSGVGTGGSGLDMTLAIISFRPVSVPLLRNL